MTLLRDLGASSTRMRYPRKGAVPMPNNPSLWDFRKSYPLPRASSHRLLALFPNEGPQSDFNSKAASNRPWWMSSRSQDLVGRK